MFRRIINRIKYILAIQHISMALSRGIAASLLRQLDPLKPNSWEFSGFSQNGEDGIVDYLTRQLKNANQYFIEIGSSSGMENNTTWLALVRKYSGIMIDGDRKAALYAQNVIEKLNLGIECFNLFITKNNIESELKIAIYNNPDVFSLDIDGNDYYIAKGMLESGFRPKIFVVEYNSAYGPSKSLTIKYEDEFNFVKADTTQLYYGVSISGWKKLFQKYRYQFVTVDMNGVNAFFIDPDEFDREFTCALNGLKFQENFYQMRKFKVKWEEQFKNIQDMDFVEI